MSTLATTLLFTLVVGTLTAAATAVRSVSRIWLRHWAERHIADGADPAAPALRTPHDFVRAAATGIAAMAFALGAIIAFREDGAELMRELLAAAVALLVIGQVIPRAVARHWALVCAPVLVPLLRILDVFIGPILGFTGRMVRPINARTPQGQSAVVSDPLEDLLREAEMEGIGAPAESEIISGVVEFGEKHVGAVMTPRARVTSVTRAMSDADIAAAVARSNYTRIPVFGDSDRDVTGVVHAFDVLEHPEQPLATLRTAASATEAEGCGAVMRRMLREHRHMAIVRTDDGRVAGIVTLEDLVEELVGDIHDEHDEPAATK